MNKLVYVMFNKKLKDRRLRLQKCRSVNDGIDPLLVDDVLSDDDEWIAQKIHEEVEDDEGIALEDDENENIIAKIDKAIELGATSASRSSKRKKQTKVGVGASKRSKDEDHETDSEDDRPVRYDDSSEDAESEEKEDDADPDPHGVFAF
ncbi:hypothetical protein J5N97_025429 [Dioscorea zingiberensis]|uniref:Uncharacterized protein n=1 Tax=Dioscorea zingiberensis TaxID=325984 RepID=A0A9D5C892_9LILI|nr:hypothetical protein J5N97_025429 [Dioscorea zingiberensis]